MTTVSSLFLIIPLIILLIIPSILPLVLVIIPLNSFNYSFNHHHQVIP